MQTYEFFFMIVGPLGIFHYYGSHIEKKILLWTSNSRKNVHANNFS
jgi:hypothetical protein